MRIKKLIVPFILVDIIILFLFYYLFFKPIKYKEEKIEKIKTIVPDWKFEIYKSPSWEGRVYKSLLTRFSVYHSVPDDFQKSFSFLKMKMGNSIFSMEIPLYESGHLYYNKKGKNSLEMVVLFCRNGEIYWVSLSGSDLFARYGEILIKFFENLEIERERVSPLAISELKRAIKDFPIPKIKRGETIIYLIFLILVASQIFIIALFHFMGKCPDKFDEEILVCSSVASVETRNALQVQVQPACICLKHGFLIVFIAGKKTMEIPIEEITWNFKKKQGRYENKIFKIPELNEWRIYLPGVYGNG